MGPIWCSLLLGRDIRPLQWRPTSGRSEDHHVSTQWDVGYWRNVRPGARHAVRAGRAGDRGQVSHCQHRQRPRQLRVEGARGTDRAGRKHEVWARIPACRSHAAPPTCCLYCPRSPLWVAAVSNSPLNTSWRTKSGLLFYNILIILINGSQIARHLPRIHVCLNWLLYLN